MEAGLLVGGGEQRRLGTSVGGECGLKVELNTLGDLVVNLNLSLENVGGRPGLGEDETVGLVEELGLDVASDEGGLGVTRATNLEGNVGGRRGLHLNGGPANGEVPAKEVVGGLAEILDTSRGVSVGCMRDNAGEDTPSRRGARAEGETWREE